MLDELLGRAALKDRIDELADEKRRLREQLDAEERRRSEAASARQDAEERVNRLEDKIAQLEGELERERDRDGDASLAYRRVEALRGERLDAVVGRLRSVDAGAEGALTAYVDDGDLPDAVAEAFGDRAALVQRAAPCLALADDAGVVSATLDVPAPPEAFCEWSDGFRVDDEWLRPTGSFALALVRAGVFAVGEYDGRERVSVRGFRSDVKGDHSKGGFSQGRFERRRDAQIDEHLADCEAAVRDVDPERLYVVGDARLVDAVDVDATATAAVDASGDPEDALDDAFYEFFTTTLRAI
ncbi:Vms1/Ankzf1 family peptidyl-tRNA hydrolase [Halorubellus sp. PRR65]|uniref:Vms1/Ankzf1 family peptidyl-tRNA hydrolase n=1 Tax=Halorubellus sp. PRR65 TaxID=3098148 RepID=UPI002B2592A4|nr:Vms1/Ankzf1 family peptidyl-tRNA hydrolase [Halorubellus sp. PRR65]